MAKKQKGITKEEAMKLASIMLKSTARVSGPKLVKK